MKDLKAPLSYHPTLKSDHIEISLGMVVKIGVRDCDHDEEMATFLAVITERIKSTGAEIILKNATTVAMSPFCGSQREKYDHDARCGRDDGVSYE